MSERYTEDELDELKRKSAAWEKKNYNNIGRSNSWDKELHRAIAFNELIDTGADVEGYGEGTALVNDKYVYALRTGKWRAINKDKWYWSKSPKDFVNRYVKGVKDD